MLYIVKNIGTYKTKNKIYITAADASVRPLKFKRYEVSRPEFTFEENLFCLFNDICDGFFVVRRSANKKKYEAAFAMATRRLQDYYGIPDFKECWNNVDEKQYVEMKQMLFNDWSHYLGYVFSDNPVA